MSALKASALKVGQIWAGKHDSIRWLIISIDESKLTYSWCYTLLPPHYNIFGTVGEIQTGASISSALVNIEKGDQVLVSDAVDPNLMEEVDPATQPTSDCFVVEVTTGRTSAYSTGPHHPSPYLRRGRICCEDCGMGIARMETLPTCTKSGSRSFADKKERNSARKMRIGDERHTQPQRHPLEYGGLATGPSSLCCPVFGGIK